MPARWLSTGPLLFLGNASYAMYILHAPLHNWLAIFFNRVLHQPDRGLAWLLTYVIAVIVISCLFYRFAEEPMHRGLRRALEARWMNRVG